MKKTYIKPNIVAVNMQEFCDETPGIVGGSNGGRAETNDPDLSKGHGSWDWDMWGNEENYPEHKNLWDD